MRKELVVLGVVLSVTAAAYLPSIDGEFLFDDKAILEDPLVVDPFVRGGSAWLESPRPLTTLSFALDHRAHGLQPRGWHVTNLAIHLCTVVLAWLFARVTLSRAGLSRPEFPALGAAAAFALHPLQTESVAYLVQRAESLASGFYLAALLLLLRRDETPEPRRRHALLGSAALLLALGLASKPIAVTVPAAWLLHSAILPASGEAGASAWRRVLRRLPAAVPLLALAAAAGIRALLGTAETGTAGFGVPGLPSHLYLATQLRVVPTYLRLLVWPAGQCADWDFPASRSWLDPPVIAGAALLAAVAGGSILAARRFRSAPGDGPAAWRAASFGALFFLLALAPSSSIVPIRDPLAEHRAYLASLGVFVAASGAAAVGLRALGRLAGRRGAAAGVAAAVALLGAAAVGTARRAAVWATAASLWRDAVEKAPHNARAHLNLGQAMYDEGRFDDALSSHRRARELGGDEGYREILLRNVVSTLVALSREDEAREEIRRALAALPDDPLALALLADVEFAAGRPEESERAALAALRIDPGNGIALKYLGFARFRRGDIGGARAALRGAAAANPIDPYLYWLLGEAEARTGEIAAACAAFSRSSELPGNAAISATARGARERLGCP